MSEANMNVFQDKTVRVWLNNGFFYQGRFVQEQGTHVLIQDRKTGFTLLKRDDIKRIEEVLR